MNIADIKNRVSIGVRGGLLTALSFFIPFFYLLIRAPTPEFFLESADHGYQLAIAQMILAGKVQGVDFFTLYGPLVGYSSALGIALSQSLIGEVIICAAFYAVSCLIAYQIVRPHAGRLGGWLAITLMLALFPRFYKWYFWLFPLLSIWFALRYSRTAKEDKISWLVISWGIVGSIATLFRIDLGFEFVIVALASILLVRILPAYLTSTPLKKRFFSKEILLFFIAYILPIAAYAINLAVATGDTFAFFGFLSSIIEASRDVAHHYSTPWPNPDFVHFLSKNNAYVLIYFGTPLIYIFAATIALRKTLRGQGSFLTHSTIVTSLAGVGIFSQAMYRPDIQHYLQAVIPFIVLLPLLAAPLFGAKMALESLKARLQGASTAIIIAVLIFTVTPNAGIDLAPTSRDQRVYWQELLNLPASRSSTSKGDLAFALQKLATPDEMVFFAMPWSPSGVLVLSQMQLAGIFPAYAPGILSSPHWASANVKSLRSHPPKLLIVNKDTWSNLPSAELAPYDFNLLSEWQKQYRHIVFQNHEFQIFARE